MMSARRGGSSGLLTEYGISAEVSKLLAPLPLLQEDLTERISEDRKYLCLGYIQCMWGRSSTSAFLLRQCLMARWQELLGQGLRGGCYRCARSQNYTGNG